MVGDRGRTGTKNLIEYAPTGRGFLCAEVEPDGRSYREKKDPFLAHTVHRAPRTAHTKAPFKLDDAMQAVAGLSLIHI